MPDPDTVLAAAKFAVGERVATYRDTRTTALPEVPSVVFEPGTCWNVARVFLRESSNGSLNRYYRLAAHGISVVTRESNLRRLPP